MVPSLVVYKSCPHSDCGPGRQAWHQVPVGVADTVRTLSDSANHQIVTMAAGIGSTDNDACREFVLNTCRIKKELFRLDIGFKAVEGDRVNAVGVSVFAGHE